MPPAPDDLDGWLTCIRDPNCLDQAMEYFQQQEITKKIWRAQLDDFAKNWVNTKIIRYTTFQEMKINDPASTVVYSQRVYDPNTVLYQAERIGKRKPYRMQDFSENLSKHWLKKL